MNGPQKSKNISIYNQNLTMFSSKNTDYKMEFPNIPTKP